SHSLSKGNGFVSADTSCHRPARGYRGCKGKAQELRVPRFRSSACGSSFAPGPPPMGLSLAAIYRGETPIHVGETGSDAGEHRAAWLVHRSRQDLVEARRSHQIIRAPACGVDRPHEPPAWYRKRAAPADG